MSDMFTSADWTRLARNTRALAESVNGIVDAIEDGFGKLPTEAQLKQGKVSFVASDTGTANAYVISLPYTPASYADGLFFMFRAANTNTGASTINVNSLGLKDLRNYAGAALTGGEVVNGAVTMGWYDATNGYARIINPLVDIASVSGIDINALTVETAPADADKAAIYDATATANRGMTLQNLLVVGWGAAASVDPAADYVLIYDADAAALKKTLINTIADEGNLILASQVFS